jgi:hypothetical protein
MFLIPFRSPERPDFSSGIIGLAPFLEARPKPEAGLTGLAPDTTSASRRRQIIQIGGAELKDERKLHSGLASAGRIAVL